MQCPHCGTDLELALVERQGKPAPQPNPVGRLVNFKMGGTPHTVSDLDIVQAAKQLRYPETIRDYYVELSDQNGQTQQYPIKQVVRKTLQNKYGSGFKEEYFTSQRARHVLIKLGFTVGVRG